jgi:hypothetical protein
MLALGRLAIGIATFESEDCSAAGPRPGAKRAIACYSKFAASALSANQSLTRYSLGTARSPPDALAGHIGRTRQPCQFRFTNVTSSVRSIAKSFEHDPP